MKRFLSAVFALSVLAACGMPVQDTENPSDVNGIFKKGTVSCLAKIDGLGGKVLISFRAKSATEEKDVQVQTYSGPRSLFLQKGDIDPSQPATVLIGVTRANGRVTYVPAGTQIKFHGNGGGYHTWLQKINTLMIEVHASNTGGFVPVVTFPPHLGGKRVTSDKFRCHN